MKAKHKNIEITFNDEDHSYVDNLSRSYLSTTTFVSQFFPKVDSRKLAEKCVREVKKYQGRDVEEVIKEWEEKGRKSRERGTLVHDYADKLVKGKELPKPINKEDEKLFKGVQLELEKLMKDYEVIGSEMIVFSPKYLLSGTIDLVMKNKKTGKIAIFDWKTNEKITKWNKFSKGLGNLSNLTDCNYMHYTMQLNVYSFILHDEGYLDLTDCEMALLHVTPKQVKRYDLDRKELELGYMLMEREDYLERRRKK